MPVLPLGVRLESLGLPIREAIVAAARLGAKAVQFDAVGELSPDQLSQTGRRQLRHLVTSHTMRIAAVGFPTRRGYDHLDRLEARVQQTKKVLNFASEMGASIVVNRMGTIPESREPKTLHFFESLEEIGREGERVGTRFAIKTGENSPERLAQFLKEMDLYGLSVDYDPANLLARGFDIYEGVYQLHPWIAGVHIKDISRTGTTITGAEEVTVGTGEIDWELLLGRLHEIEYTGYLIVDRETAGNNVSEITAAFEHLGPFL